jgi:hypothetical protein
MGRCATLARPPTHLVHRMPALPASWRLAAPAVSLTLILAVSPSLAQSTKLEATYVVLGPQGAVARAVVADATRCPAITIDGREQPMNVRATPEPTFPVLVCELQVSAGAASASIENSPLPLQKAELKSIAAFGDTGCRLKAAKAKGRDHDDDGGGRFQNCNVPSAWPFAQVAATIAAAKPDLVIHVGDYLYRESECPPRDTGCARSPMATTGRPGRPISSRRRRQRCARRPGSWYAAITKSAAAPRRLFPPARSQAGADPAQAPPPCIDLIRQYTVTFADQSFVVLDSSNAADDCPCDPARYAAEFSAMRPKPGTWLVTHRPIWGFRPKGKTINASLQQGLAAWNGKLPDGITLALAGHIHVAEVLSFTDRRSPQFVLGTGGTMLAGKIKGDLKGEKIAGTTVSYGRADHRFGFAMLAPAAQGEWTATFRDNGNVALFECRIGDRRGRV